MTLAQRMKQLRKEKKITQEQLAEKIGMERSSVGKYETGTIPSPEILSAMSDYFDVSIDYLLGKSEIRKPEKASKEGQSKPDENDVRVALFGGDGEVTDEMWEKLKDYANYLKSTYKK